MATVIREFNLNSYIQVKPRDAAVAGKILRAFAGTPMEDGWFRGQAWSILAAIEESFQLGFDPPITPTIKMEFEE